VVNRRLGYDAKRLADMLELAKQRRLPEDRKTAGKMLRLGAPKCASGR
jgi:hypothetical protein